MKWLRASYPLLMMQVVGNGATFDSEWMREQARPDVIGRMWDLDVVPSYVLSVCIYGLVRYVSRKG